MKNVGININHLKENKDEEKKKIIKIIKDILIKNNFNVEIIEDLNKSIKNNLDTIICLGGDGTILRTARYVYEKGIPILGINFGNLGFLTTSEKNELKDTINKFVKEKYTIEERMMLNCSLKCLEKEKNINALNDIVLSKGTLSRIINYDIFINKKYYTTVKADGIIISTPTGSTAYSLSAGGPIIHPDVKAVNITPICPVNLSMGSLVLNDNIDINIKFSRAEEEVFLTIDGQENFNLNKDTEVIIKKSNLKCKLIRIEGYNYFEALRKKIIFRN